MQNVYWHRLLGVVLSDFLFGRRAKVEIDRDGSLKQQVLDILIIEQSAGAARGNRMLGRQALPWAQKRDAPID